LKAAARARKPEAKIVGAPFSAGVVPAILAVTGSPRSSPFSAATSACASARSRPSVLSKYLDAQRTA
jgi:hypothetical protein